MADEDKRNEAADRAHATLGPIHRLATEGEFALRPTFAAVHRAMTNLINELTGNTGDSVDAGPSRDETAFSINREGKMIAAPAHTAAATQAMLANPGDPQMPDAADFPALGDGVSPQSAMVRAPNPLALAAKPAPDPTLPPPSDQVGYASPGLTNVSGDATEGLGAGSDTRGDIDPHAGYVQAAPGMAVSPEGDESPAAQQQGAYTPQPLPPAADEEQPAQPPEPVAPVEPVSEHAEP